MEWNLSDIKVIDTVKGIRERRHMYFLNGIASYDDLIGRMSADILEIPHARMIVFRAENWCIIGSDKPWIPVPEDRSISEFFFRIVPTPERGYMAMRTEVFLTAVSKDLVLFLPEFHLIVQGEVTETLLLKIYPMTTCQQMIAFRLSPEFTTSNDHAQ